MEEVFAEKPNIIKLVPTNTNQLDLTLKLSPCGQNVEKWLTRSSSISGEKAKSTVANEAQEGPLVPWLDRSCSLPAEAEKGLIRFGDLQTMRRMKTGKRWLLEKQRRAAAAEADKSPTVSLPLAGGLPLTHALDKLKKTPSNPSRDSCHEGGANSNVQTSPKQENDSMVSPRAMLKEMPLRQVDAELESPAKRLKTVNPFLKGDAIDIPRQMPSVTTTGDGPSGKRIKGLLYKYRRGEICIVCVCHGCFLSPAEFVMHAGGKEVANPMEHITVSSSSF